MHPLSSWRLSELLPILIQVKRQPMKNLGLFIIAIAMCTILSCSKEESSAAPIEPMSELQSAKNFLLHTPTLVPFVVVELNHITHEIKGIMVDKAAKLRTLSLTNATYLHLDYPHLSEQFMHSMFDESEVETDLSPIELADQLRKMDIQESAIRTMTEQPEESSKIYLALTVNTEHIDPSDCGSGSPDAGPTFRKNILAIQGKYNYVTEHVNELRLLNWLKSVEIDPTEDQ